MKLLQQLLKLRVKILSGIGILVILLFLTFSGNLISIKTTADADEKANEYNEAFIKYQCENITVYYHPDIRPAIKQINAYLNQAEENTSELFPKAKQESLTIKFDYDKEVFRELYPERKDSQGFYLSSDNRINILVEDCYSDILALSNAGKHFKDTVLHEYCHYKLKSYLDYNKLKLEDVPMWFNEGIACYIGCEGAYKGDEPEVIVPFEKLADSNEWTRYSNETKGDVYDQAYVCVGKLILSKGKRIIEDILLGTKNLSFEAAFTKAVGLSLQDYEKALEADMKSGWNEYSKLIAEQNPIK